jgi:hypothetical protein
LLFLHPVQLFIIYAEVAQLVEHHLAKVRVAGSNLVFRSLTIPRGWFFFPLSRPGGGTGRHAGLKILFAEKASAGSIPAPGTKQIFIDLLFLCLISKKSSAVHNIVTF